MLLIPFFLISLVTSCILEFRGLPFLPLTNGHHSTIFQQTHTHTFLSWWNNNKITFHTFLASFTDLIFVKIHNKCSQCKVNQCYSFIWITNDWKTLDTEAGCTTPESLEKGILLRIPVLLSESTSPLVLFLEAWVLHLCLVISCSTREYFLAIMEQHFHLFRRGVNYSPQ